ncbi:hypothetical protein KXD97_28455 [Mycobacterium sp. SMC-8]|uniref:hypothetical protein n=1 Tax=Mycobacterium sp. SMC-8 TaxID=2857060 RepID=UPI0021B3AE5E|nr:hypothetical protein [Mycobacterium sp. SMC-8]UXA11844.1 hypothetical protein KXD97_28455 [Mycobacterium sp. SMC-8]
MKTISAIAALAALAAMSGCSIDDGTVETIRDNVESQYSETMAARASESAAPAPSSGSSGWAGMPNLEMPPGVSWYRTENDGMAGVWSYNGKKDDTELRSQIYRRVDEQLMRGGWEECPASADPVYEWIRDTEGFRLHFVAGSGYTMYVRLTRLPYEMANGCP